MDSFATASELLDQARVSIRAGDSHLADSYIENDSLGSLLESFRSYLRVLADSQLSRRLSQRVSGSDIIQETMLVAHRDFASFRGESVGQFTAWLRTILSSVLIKTFEKHAGAMKRSVNREISLGGIRESLDATAIGLSNILVSNEGTPSEIVSREEQALAIIALLETLPDDYRRVIELRSIQELRFERVAEEMGRSAVAVRLLWMRAVRKLRETYEANHG
jgi:RNA polymerase sigma-70 factor, ECF subfamily